LRQRLLLLRAFAAYITDLPVKLRVVAQVVIYDTSVNVVAASFFPVCPYQDWFNKISHCFIFLFYDVFTVAK
jgi:hypothetical protein